MHEELKGLPVPLSEVDDSERREQLVATARLRPDDQQIIAWLLIILSICVLIWLWFYESGRKNVSGIVENTTRELKFQIDLNSAPKSEILQLPGIGEVLAERIVEHRETVAPFENVADLQKIYGIGIKKRESATPYVYIGERDEGAGASDIVDSK